ncbi:MAG: Asp23/Gls24 family envelope stress response protein [Lentisphaeria bacterium]
MTSVTDSNMTENEFLMEDNTETGLIRISEDVIISVVKFYTLKVAGVARFASASLSSGIVDIFKKTNTSSAVQIEMEQEHVNISVSLILQFGVNVPNTAELVQDIIREKVEEITGKRVNRVDVTVRDLAMKNAKDDDLEDNSDN